MRKNIVMCNFCGNKKYSMLYSDNEHLAVCSECGLVYTKSAMTVEAMKNFYDEGYFISNNSVSKGYTHYFNSERNLTNTFEKRIKLINSFWKKEPGRMLDIGCAAGFFLQVAHLRNWDVCGVDISKVCVEYAKEKFGIEVKNGLFVDLEMKKSTFDVITMWDYLEHSAAPKEDIVKARNLLKEDGLIVIATPDVSSIPSRIFKSKWIGIKLEEHFYYFSRKILVDFLKNIGFDVLNTSYVGKYVSSEMFLDRLVHYNKFLSRTFGKVLNKIKFDFYCNPFDIMLIIAKRKR